MIDYVVLDISYLEWSEIGSNEILEWLPLYDPITGELNPMFYDLYKKRKIRPDYIAKYKGLTFERYTKNKPKISLRGSLHYYHNNGAHNYNEYTIEDHRAVLNDLFEKFGIEPSKTKIHHIEICVLLLLIRYNAKQILENILVHGCKGAPLKRYNYETKRTNALFKRLVRNRFCIKAYSKSLQFDLPYDLFKFELKYFKMKDLNKMGLVYLSDTLDAAVLEKLGNDMEEKWNDTFLYDWTIENSKLSAKDATSIKDYRNPNYWMHLSNTRNAVSRHRNRYKEIELKHSEHIHDFILQEIRKMWCKLTLSKSNIKDHKRCKVTNSMELPCKLGG